MLEGLQRALAVGQIFRGLGKDQTHRNRSKEEKKVIIRISFWVALRRCRIHLIPILFTITILYLNLKGYYIGTTFASLVESETLNLLLLQIAAKAQELLVIASLAKVIFHVARNELLFGDGLPLGLVGSGLLFNNFGYFFSSEFVGSLSYAGNKWKKARFLILLLVAGMTAALAGPATAVLIVPRSQQVDAGGTSFFMKGSDKDLWPIELDETAAGNLPYCTSSNGTKFAACPSAGFQSLWAHFGQADFSTFKTATTSRSYAKLLSGTSSYWSIDSPLALIPRVFALGNLRIDGEHPSNTFLVQPHAATVVLLQQATTDWWESLLWETKRTADTIDDRLARSTGKNPLTQVKCTSPQNVSRTAKAIVFPVMNPPVKWGGYANLSLESLNKGASDHLRFQWVHLPSSFGPATIGSVFESAWTSDNSSRVVIGCTLQSTWINATLYTDEYTFWSGWYPWNIVFDKQTPAWVPPKDGEPINSTNGRIAVKDAWLDMLTPATPEEGPGYYTWQPSTMESILMNTGLARTLTPASNSTMALDWHEEDMSGISRTGLLEAIVCSVFEDGLSRAGSHLIYEKSSQPSQWKLSTYFPKQNFNESILKGKDALEPPSTSSQDFTKLRVDFKITGYAFNRSLAGYLAMSVLLVHMVFALCHTAWILTRQKTSDSWDSMSKIIALATNSRPAFTTLKNTGAGIDRLRTYGRTAKIRATELGDNSEIDHVELIFQSNIGDMYEHPETPVHGFDGIQLESQLEPTLSNQSKSGVAALSVSGANSIRGLKNSVTSLLQPVGFSTSVGLEDIVQPDCVYG